MFFDTDDLLKGIDETDIEFRSKNNPILPHLRHTYVFENEEKVDIAIAKFIDALIVYYDSHGFNHLNPYHRSTKHNHYSSVIIYNERGAMVFFIAGNYERYTVICDVEIF